MTSNLSSISLSPETQSAVWRIFGAGESLLTKKSSYDLIELVLKKHGSSKDVQEVRSWFDTDKDKKWLKYEWHGPVADLIIPAIQSEITSGRKETAVWAAGAVSAKLSLPIIHSASWCPEEIDSFVETAISVLEKVYHANLLVDAGKLHHFGSHESVVARIPKSAVIHKNEGTLQTFIRLDRDSRSPGLHSCLYPVVFNLTSLIVHLQPNRFQEVIRKLDHPIVQIHIAWHMIAVEKKISYCSNLESIKALEWITKESCDSVIALAIISTLNAVKRLDDDRCSASYQDVDQDHSDAEISASQNQRHAATNTLLHDLVTRLFQHLEPQSCIRWVGELLSGAPHILDFYSYNSAPFRIKQLEESCTKLLAEHIFQLPLEDFLPNFCAGLRLTPRNTWTRHLAALAWEIRAKDPAKASTVAQATINVYEQQITMELQKNKMFIYWEDYHYRAWIKGIGYCLVLAQPGLNSFAWIVEHCCQVPLSVWDIEENAKTFWHSKQSRNPPSGVADSDVETSYGKICNQPASLTEVRRARPFHISFNTANCAVQHWFLVGLCTVTALRELDQPCDSQAIYKIIELLWSHCHFARKYLFDNPANSIVSEVAVCLAVEAALDDAWLFDIARHPGVGPLALLVILHEHQRIIVRTTEVCVHRDDYFRDRLKVIAQQKFHDDNMLDFESVWYWARLWLLLEAADEAERTAIALTTFSSQQNNRPTNILILKLLALASTRKELSVTVANLVRSLYKKLWQYSTLSEERADREIVDRYLQESPTLMP